MTTREFAARLLREAGKPDPSAARLQPRAQVRLIEHALHEAVKMQLEVGFTIDHLDAVLAVMRTTATRQSSLRDYVPADVTGWEAVLIEVLRINLHGTDPPQPSRSNAPNLQQIPRSESINWPVQSTMADRAVGGAIGGAVAGAALGALGSKLGKLGDGLGAIGKALLGAELTEMKTWSAQAAQRARAFATCAACSGHGLLHTCSPK